MFLFRFLLLLRRPELQSGDVLLFFFQFLSILAISMATAAILKKSTL
jgi:hypothetical protein